MSGDYAEFASYVTEEDKWPPTKHYTSLEQACGFIYGFSNYDFMAPPPSQAHNPWLQQIAVAAAEKPVEGEDDWAHSVSPPKAPERVGLNAPCPCGSGKKYKRCHGKEG